MKMTGKTHKNLQLSAINWLRNEKQCKIYADEIGIWRSDNRAQKMIDICDVVGLSDNGTSYCIEIKASRDDLRKGRQLTISLKKEAKFSYYYLLLPNNLPVSDKLDKIWRDWGILRANENMAGGTPTLVKEAKKVKVGSIYNKDLKNAIFSKLIRKNYEKLFSER
jgi:hypothetical protein